MHAKIALIAFLLAVSWPLTAAASDMPRGGRMLHGQSPSLVKADQDTVYLLGGPGSLDGRFESSSGTPNWQG